MNLQFALLNNAQRNSAIITINLRKLELNMSLSE